MFLTASIVFAARPFPAHAYAFIADPPYVWPDGNVSVVLKLGNAGRTLLDGNFSWDTVARQALSAWNPYLGTIQFVPTTQSPGVGSDGDRINQAFFNSTIYGKTFGSGVLAVTTGWYVGTTRIEGDVTFNNAISWDSYRGPLRFSNGQLICDLRRVAIHEFGHVLGLDHPDQAGQSVSAIMNSTISNIDALQYDDITGAQVLYSPQPQPPAITTQPESQTVVAGNGVSFSVAATGTAPLAYQWQRNGLDILDATNSTYSIGAVQAGDAAYYTVFVSNSVGNQPSSAAILTVLVPPTITAQPQSQTVNTGVDVTFTVDATGNPAPSYQWQLNGADIAGATASSYTRNNVQPADAGGYTTVVSNTAGSIPSQVATLTINVPPIVSLSVSTNGMPLYAPATISLTASASDTDGNVTQVDFYEGTNLIGAATTSPFSLTWNSVPTGSYTLTARAIDNLGATAASAPVSVTVSPATECIPAPNGLVTWWPGDGSAQDETGNRNGVVFGGTTFVAGKVGQAFSFNGIDGYVRLDNTVATTTVDNWAMAAWVYWKGIVGAADKEKQTLLYNGNEGGNGYGLIIPEQGLCSTESSLCSEVGKLVILYGGVAYLPTGVALDQSSWSHLALVREDGVLKLYKNGTLAFSTKTANPPNPPSAADGYLTIGSSPGYAFNGLMDEVMFFNAAITAHEVGSLFAADNLGACKPLTFDGIVELADGSVLLNLSGQAGKNLTIYSSSDFLNWLSVVTLPNPTGAVQFTNVVGSSNYKFYKATSE